VAKRRKKMKKISILFAICCLLFSIIGCNKKDEAKDEIERMNPVKVTNVTKGDIEEIISLTGDIHGEKEVNVYPKVPGKLFNKIKQEGDFVRKGNNIALIDRDEPAMNFSKAEVKSPINGIVIMYFAEIGDAISPARKILTVANMDDVKIVVHLSETDIGRVKKGLKARIFVDAYPDRVFKGIVTNVAPAANPMTRKLKVEITVPNPGHLLKPGIFARADIVTKEHKNILIVPRLAVLEGEGGNVVFTVENGRAKMIKVVTGAEDEKNIEIKQGLSEGDEVIIEGNYGLIENSKVEIQKTEDR
jgi:multidrug efflux pump subunit AcrA (membrane-fusion protein)